MVMSTWHLTERNPQARRQAPWPRNFDSTTSCLLCCFPLAEGAGDEGGARRRVLDALAASNTAAVSNPVTPSPLRTTMRSPIGFSFSPAGLLGPYHLGVLSYLCEANVINQYTPVAGNSILLGTSFSRVYMCIFRAFLSSEGVFVSLSSLGVLILRSLQLDEPPALQPAEKEGLGREVHRAVGKSRGYLITGLVPL